MKNTRATCTKFLGRDPSRSAPRKPQQLLPTGSSSSSSLLVGPGKDPIRKHLDWRISFDWPSAKLLISFLLSTGYTHNPYNGVIYNDTILATGVFSSKELWRLSKSKSQLISLQKRNFCRLARRSFCFIGAGKQIIEYFLVKSHNICKALCLYFWTRTPSHNGCSLYRL